MAFLVFPVQAKDTLSLGYRKTQLHMDHVWVLPHGGGKELIPREGTSTARMGPCRSGAHDGQQFALWDPSKDLCWEIPEIQVGNGKAHSECTAHHNFFVK